MLEHELAYHYLDGTTTPREVWEAICKHYCSDDCERLVAIDVELMGLRLHEGGDVIEHATTFCSLCCQLDSTNFAVHDECTIS